MYSKKNTIIIVMCMAILMMGVGYALLSTKIRIGGSTAVTSTWKVEFTDIRTTSLKGGATNLVPPTASATTATFSVDLVQPGDEVKYEIDITNYGDVKAEIQGATYSITGSKAIYVAIDGIRKGTILDSCEGLETCPTETATITIGYDPNVEKDPDEKTKDITIVLNIGQYVDTNPTPDGELIPEYNDDNIPVKTEFLSAAILKNNDVQSDENINFTSAMTSASSYGLYYTSTNTENDLPTYYFRGNVTNNFIYFGGFYWRIVRINEDGSIRLIYNGTSTEATGSELMIGQSKFNDVTTSDNAYIGYMYGLTGTTTDSERCLTLDTSTNKAVVSNLGKDACITAGGKWTMTAYEATHANVTSSTVKVMIDNWYEDNLLDDYSIYLADAGFCNDRTIVRNQGVTGDTGLGYGSNLTYYGANKRIYLEHTPQFACPNPSNDLFTTSTSTKGNKALTYPIGLITADEVSYAGGTTAESTNFYLTNVSWTMSPRYVNSSHGFIARNGSNGKFIVNGVKLVQNVRPVINLKATVRVTGSGTKLEPYVVVTD